MRKVKGFLLGAVIAGTMLCVPAYAESGDGGEIEINEVFYSVAAGGIASGTVGAILWKMSNTKKTARDANKNIVSGASEILGRQLNNIHVSKHSKKND